MFCYFTLSIFLTCSTFCIWNRDYFCAFLHSKYWFRCSMIMSNLLWFLNFIHSLLWLLYFLLIFKFIQFAFQVFIFFLQYIIVLSISIRILAWWIWITQNFSSLRFFARITKFINLAKYFEPFFLNKLCFPSFIIFMNKVFLLVWFWIWTHTLFLWLFSNKEFL